MHTGSVLWHPWLLSIALEPTGPETNPAFPTEGARFFPANPPTRSRPICIPQATATPERCPTSCYSTWTPCDIVPSPVIRHSAGPYIYNSIRDTIPPVNFWLVTRSCSGFFCRLLPDVVACRFLPLIQHSRTTLVSYSGASFVFLASVFQPCANHYLGTTNL
ncbi:hypothetical protein B0T25DRAFT_175115 [Lasiosphaeria hispida]|uniref:Uncharacterized protein n=1 Tax=Lasiosphaeria hispida TaxID=260671 RepID=A0AAJ0HNG7_9PEZI|nr:hypothetical protein B0T25DRAFT_175115 [Lasiosphaeria hispida]